MSTRFELDFDIYITLGTCVLLIWLTCFDVDMGRHARSGKNVETIAEDGRGSICGFA